MEFLGLHSYTTRSSISLGGEQRLLEKKKQQQPFCSTSVSYNCDQSYRNCTASSEFINHPMHKLYLGIGKKDHINQSSICQNDIGKVIY